MGLSMSQRHVSPSRTRRGTLRQSVTAGLRSLSGMGRGAKANRGRCVITHSAALPTSQGADVFTLREAMRRTVTQDGKGEARMAGLLRKIGVSAAALTVIIPAVLLSG